MGVDFARAEVVPELPARLLSGRGRPLPDNLIGAEIVAIGTLADRMAVAGGGLVIDFREPGEQTVRRLVFAFNEEGMWVEYRGLAQSDSIPV